jgi:hypothetical protein
MLSHWQLAIGRPTCLASFSIGTARSVNLSASQKTMLNSHLPIARGGFPNFLMETQLVFYRVNELALSRYQSTERG